MHERRSFFFLFPSFVYIENIFHWKHSFRDSLWGKGLRFNSHSANIRRKHFFATGNILQNKRGEKVGLINMLSEEILNISKIIFAVLGAIRVERVGGGRNTSFSNTGNNWLGEKYQKIWSSGRNPNALLWNDVNWAPFRWNSKQPK